MQPPNRELIVAYKKLLKDGKIKENKLIEELLVKAGVRTQSGIAIITSLVKPYMCPGKCVYCPTEVRMPKSYIATEPAAARALRLDFSPYEQMARRIEMLEGNGHKTDKIEFIIKGGTWNAYPLRYQYWFILESFRAANEFSPKHIRTSGLSVYPDHNDLTDQSSIEELQAALEVEQTKNETSEHRIIGITLETRPDAIAPRTIAHMRRQGCTRIELGLQAPDDDILKLIKRGHTVEQFREAMKLLREAGFKVDLHFMPDLPGTTPNAPHTRRRRPRNSTRSPTSSARSFSKSRSRSRTCASA
jgi:elongator complex protein 3